MSSKKAVYESSMLCAFGADDDELTDSGFTIVGGPETVLEVEVDIVGFGLDFATAFSLLTRTDAGIIAVSSGVC